MKKLTIAVAVCALSFMATQVAMSAPAMKPKPSTHKFKPTETVAYCPKCNQVYSEKGGKMIFMRDSHGHKLVLEPYKKVPKNAQIVGLGRNNDIF